MLRMVRCQLTCALGSGVFAGSVLVLVLLFASNGLTVTFSTDHLTVFELLLPKYYAKCSSEFNSTAYGILIATQSVRWSASVLSAIYVLPFLYGFTAQYRGNYYAPLSRMSLKSYVTAVCISSMCVAVLVVLAAYLVFAGLVLLLFPSLSQCTDSNLSIFLDVYGKTAADRLRYLVAAIGNDLAAVAVCPKCAVAGQYADVPALCVTQAQRLVYGFPVQQSGV